MVVAYDKNIANDTISLKNLTPRTLYTVSLQAVTSEKIGSQVNMFDVSTLGGKHRNHGFGVKMLETHSIFRQGRE